MLPVLDAALAEPDIAVADLVVVTGDHASGPQPTAVLDRLTVLGGRVLLVRGNADRELVAAARGQLNDPPDDVPPGPPRSSRRATSSCFPDSPTPSRWRVAGFGPVLLCHGTPRNDEEVVLVDTRLSRWQEALTTVPDDVRTVVCGHTHMPFTRLVDRRIVVNPGSIGMPYGRPGGAWALLGDGQVGLRPTTVDIGASIEAVVAGSTYPDRHEWANYYLRAAASDAEAITAFGPRDGRPTESI